MLLYRARQELISKPLNEVAEAVSRALDDQRFDVPHGEVAVTVGSRGIANLPVIIKTVGEWLKKRGAFPFIVPCMGSHNGATAAGQREMLETLGITEQATRMEIRASMDVVCLGSVGSGEVFMDRSCFEADGVVVVNRIKPHTCFSGPVQSGLMKMMVVGMGKAASATTFHSTANAQMAEMLLEMGRVILNTGKIVGGLALIEDGLDQTAEIHALRPDRFLEEEPFLLERASYYFPRLPVDELDVLIVDQIGKNLSGTGMDTNVIGWRGVKNFEDLSKPRINVIAALGLSSESHGNALGVGLADVITKRCRDAIDEHKTAINCLTTGDLGRGKIPLTFADDEELIQALGRRFGEDRWMFISDTAHLSSFYVTAGLCAELASHPQCSVERQPLTLSFVRGRHTLVF